MRRRALAVGAACAALLPGSACGEPAADPTRRAGDVRARAAAGTGQPGRPSSGFAAILPRDLFEAMFPNRHAVFTYDGLVQAAQRFPDFANTGDAKLRAREAAAFLANIAHETTGGWPSAPGGPQAWGLVFPEERDPQHDYCRSLPHDPPCAPGRSYHGRGAIQLSWNYNYGLSGRALGRNLLHEPDLVAEDPVLAFQTAIWFWMSAQGPKPAAHTVMTAQWRPTAADTAAKRRPGFGMTILIINGGVECGGRAPRAVEDRLAYYRHFCALLNTDPGPNQSCGDMAPYP